MFWLVTSSTIGSTNYSGLGSLLTPYVVYTSLHPLTTLMFIHPRMQKWKLQTAPFPSSHPDPKAPLHQPKSPRIRNGIWIRFFWSHLQLWDWVHEQRSLLWFRFLWVTYWGRSSDKCCWGLVWVRAGWLSSIRVNMALTAWGAGSCFRVIFHVLVLL
jgi:hypothetical protein